MEDPDSEAAATLRKTFAEGLKAALFDRRSLETADNDISVEVVDIR